MAADARDVNFPETIRVNERTLTLSGTGVLSYKKFLKVYVAALYVDETAPGFDVATQRIEVEYLMGAKAKRLNAAGRRILERFLRKRLSELRIGCSASRRFTQTARSVSVVLSPIFQNAERCCIMTASCWVKCPVTILHMCI